MRSSKSNVDATSVKCHTFVGGRISKVHVQDEGAGDV